MQTDSQNMVTPQLLAVPLKMGSGARKKKSPPPKKTESGPSNELFTLNRRDGLSVTE